MNLTEIKSILQEYTIAPTKSRGQNFLFDENIVKKIIDSANLSKKDTILEIGPGLGVLTDYIIDKTERVIAVELDRNMLKYLNNRYKDAQNLTIIEGDILKIDINSLNLPKTYKIVANLPYNITSNFIRRFLEADPGPTEMVVMVQKEVAKRMITGPGKMSLLSVAVQFYADVDILFEVSRNSFWPAPKVDSAVIRIKMKKKPEYDDVKQFFRIVKMGFSSKRKQLQNNLSGGLQIDKDKVKEIILSAGLDEKIRAQDLSLSDWIKILKLI